MAFGWHGISGQNRVIIGSGANGENGRRWHERWQRKQISSMKSKQCGKNGMGARAQ